MRAYRVCVCEKGWVFRKWCEFFHVEQGKTCVSSCVLCVVCECACVSEDGSRGKEEEGEMGPRE